MNNRFLDLAAQVAADDHDIDQLKDLTDQATAAAEVFRTSIRKANLAAEPLVFDADPNSRIGQTRN